jgi:UDP-N-acetylmuramate: L-alanyl-gamma-D-glutamyl-meso-diaminopimelate ligase
MKIHFTGLAGAGMSAAAMMMRGAGHQVTGSDADAFPPISTYVERMGLTFHRSFNAANLPENLDLLVVGASAKLGGDANSEVVAARARGVRVTTFPELVGEATVGRETIVVAGSFGKSTCAALMAHVLRSAGRDPGYLIGALPRSLPATGAWGTSPEVVLEGDEYIVGPDDHRSKFLLYHPHDLLLTSLIHDHVNVFPTFDSYTAPFHALTKLVAPDGLIVARRSDDIAAAVAGSRARVVWYDTAPHAGWFSRDVVYGDVTRFALVGPDGSDLTLSTTLLGAHNVENIVGVAALLLERGLVAPEALARGVAGFEGIQRRLDRKTTTSRVPVFEGFGSSYEKARSAIEAMKLHYPDRPLIVVFEPHAFSWRNREALPWYDTVFDGAARVLVAPPPEHGAGGHDQTSLAEIVERIRKAGVQAEPAPTAEAVLDALADLTGRETVLLLSSGPLLGLPDRLPARFDLIYPA